MWGGDEFAKKEKELIRLLTQLKPRPQEEMNEVYATSWAFLKAKGSG